MLPHLDTHLKGGAEQETAHTVPQGWLQREANLTGSAAAVAGLGTACSWLAINPKGSRGWAAHIFGCHSGCLQAAEELRVFNGQWLQLSFVVSTCYCCAVQFTSSHSTQGLLDSVES